MKVKFNAKARRSAAGSSKQKRNRKGVDDTQFDTNAVIHKPKTKDEKELDRKELLRQELAAQSDSKMNSKKKKRLDKYIEKKLKQEERLAILKKLSESQAQISSADLQSSSTLGTGRASTNKEWSERLEDKEVRRAIEGRTGKRKRAGGYPGFFSPPGNDDEDEGLDSDASRHLNDDPEQPDEEETSIVDFGVVTQAVEPSAVGSALRRNADGSVDPPKMVKRKSKGKQTRFRSWKDVAPPPSLPQPDEVSETSFDSSDSANDSDYGGKSTDEENSGSESLHSEDEGQIETHQLGGKRGFKDWALKQLSVAKGYVAPADSSDPPQTTEPVMPPPSKKRKIDTDPSKPREMRGPLGEDLQLPTSSFAKHVQKCAGLSKNGQAIAVSRPPDVQEARLLLPIISEEQQIMEAVLLNPVMIICGETGSGKTTQVPQFLYEAGYGSPGSENPGLIGITQPRRVAAMSMAARVGHELSLTTSRVSYQIRYDATVSPSTSIKFMTDGVMLRELATDFLLSKYSVIVIDEAHERSMNTDILIGVLSRVLRLREEMWKEGKEGAKPLRLIIMSATLRISDFSENKSLFPSPPPVINVPARQHPVTIHFSRRTVSDYVTESVKKASKIHSRLPPGGILIFLTGQNEITGVCRKLEAKYGQKALDEKRKGRSVQRNVAVSGPDDSQDSRIVPVQADVEAEDVNLGGSAQDDLAFDVDDNMADDDSEALDSDDERDMDELGLDENETDCPMHLVPLYSLLPGNKQMRVFQPPPLGARLVVVSTNVAETSLTIPGIRYVIDCGRAKERRYDVANGIQAFQVAWISKASAAQRAGRAGRTGPGHCYRLYSSALFEHYFDPFSRPEILRMPIEGIILQMKSVHIDTVVNFPFPTPPDRKTLEKAETTLTHLGALAIPSSPLKGSTSSATIGGTITELGRAMSLFPLSPRYSRMLVSGRVQGCLPYLISIVCALSVGDPFLREDALEHDESESDDDSIADLSHIKNPDLKAKEANKLRRKAFFQSQHVHASLGNFSSDMFRLLSVVGAYEYAGGGHKFCTEHFLRLKAMEEIHKLRAQISHIVQANFQDIDVKLVPNLRPPNDLQLKVIRQLITAGFIDQVAVRKDRVEKGSSSGVQNATARGVPYRALGISEDVFIHPSSVLANTPPPEYIVFNEVVRSTRVWLNGLTVVHPAWLSTLGKPSLCTFSKPVKNSAGKMMVIPSFGPDGWELPPVSTETQQ